MGHTIVVRRPPRAHNPAGTPRARPNSVNPALTWGNPGRHVVAPTLAGEGKLQTATCLVSFWGGLALISLVGLLYLRHLWREPDLPRVATPTEPLPLAA